MSYPTYSVSISLSSLSVPWKWKFNEFHSVHFGHHHILYLRGSKRILESDAALFELVQARAEVPSPYSLCSHPNSWHFCGHGSAKFASRRRWSWPSVRVFPFMRLKNNITINLGHWCVSTDARVYPHRGWYCNWSKQNSGMIFKTLLQWASLGNTYF